MEGAGRGVEERTASLPFNWKFCQSSLGPQKFLNSNTAPHNTHAMHSWGRDCMKFAVDNHNVGYYCLFFCFCIMSGLYILDFSYWER